MGTNLDNAVTTAPAQRGSNIGVLWRPVFAIIALLLLIYGTGVYGELTAQSRISPEVQAAAATERYVDVNVVLAFGPEDFHIQYLQKLGTVSGVEGTTVRLRRVRSNELQELASNYWIERIDKMTFS